MVIAKGDINTNFNLNCLNSKHLSVGCNLMAGGELPTQTMRALILKRTVKFLEIVSVFFFFFFFGQ